MHVIALKLNKKRLHNIEHIKHMAHIVPPKTVTGRLKPEEFLLEKNIKEGTTGRKYVHKSRS